MTRNRYLLVALPCLLATLCGCSAMMPRNHAYTPPTSRPTPAAPTESDTKRPAVDQALEHISNQQYQAALDLLEPLRPPTRQRTEQQQAQILFWIAYCYEKQGRPDDAKPLYQHVRDAFTDTPFAATAQARLEVLEEP